MACHARASAKSQRLVVHTQVANWSRIQGPDETCVRNSIGCRCGLCRREPATGLTEYNSSVTDGYLKGVRDQPEIMRSQRGCCAEHECDRRQGCDKFERMDLSWTYVARVEWGL